MINYNCVELESILIGIAWLRRAGKKILAKSTSRHHYVESEEFLCEKEHARL